MRTPVTELVLLVCVVATIAHAQPEASCTVRYLSADHVYLDAGRLAGLSEGAEVRILRDNTQIALLTVYYAADHSATCTIELVDGEIRVGDRAFYVATVEPTAPATAEPDSATRRQRELRAPATTTARARAPGPHLTGSAALRWDYTAETGGSGLASQVLSLPFRVRFRELGKGWELRARGNLRRIARTGGGDWRVSDTWRNRIYEAALVRDGRRANWHLAVGRIGSRATAVAGPLDGLAVNRRIAAGLRLGAFGGWAPAWGELDFHDADQLVGLTLQMDPVGHGAGGLRMLLAGIGRYHEGEVSREYLAMTTIWRGGPGVTLLQAAEVDFNRGWKRETGADAVRLTSLAVTGRWQANRRLTVVAGYDDREAVRTWETRDRPDSLFHHAGRRGLRGGLELRDGSGRRVNLDAAVRKPAGGGDDTRSWSARVWLPGWPWRVVDLDLSVRGFEGRYLGGVTPALGVSHRSRGGWYLRGTTGFYAYTDQIGDDDRTSYWLSLASEKELARNWMALIEARGDGGDATGAFTLILEIRRRF